MNKKYCFLLVSFFALSGTAFASCGTATTALASGKGCGTITSSSTCQDYYMSNVCLTYDEYNQCTESGDIACKWGSSCTDVGGEQCTT